MSAFFSQASDWIILSFSQSCFSGFSSSVVSFLPFLGFELYLAFPSALD